MGNAIAISVTKIYNYYKKHGYKTIKTQSCTSKGTTFSAAIESESKNPPVVGTVVE